MASAPIDLNDITALEQPEAAQSTHLTGVGALAQGGGDAIGAAGVKTTDNSGTILTLTHTRFVTRFVTHHHDAAGGALAKEQIARQNDEIARQKEQIARQVAGYLSWLRALTQYIEWRGSAPEVRLPLETAYVPLQARWMADDGGDLATNQLLGFGNRLVIVGGPGSGKTTVLLHIAWALACSLLTGTSEPAHSGLGLMSASGGPITPKELPLPIFVPLASFARYRRHLPGDAQPLHGTLAHFISHHLINRQANLALPADFFVQLLEDGRDVVLLLDGLDEVANEDERAEVRQSVEDLVGGRASMRVLVTCRTIAYRVGRTALGAEFRKIVVQPLDFAQHITPMVRQAYACIHQEDRALSTNRVKDLLDGIARLEEERRVRQGKDARALVDSPLMLRLLLIVHVNNRRLPDERADLFEKAIDALLRVDYGRVESDIRELSTDWTRFRDMAQHLAFHMHRQGRTQGREIEEPDLKSALRQEARFLPHVDGFLSQARRRGSLLEERNGVYRFIHLAFQEFLVARYLRTVIGPEDPDAILTFLDGRLEDPWWREPILLLVGSMAGQAADATRTFLGALAKAGASAGARFSAIELAGVAAQEWRESGPEIRLQCVQQVVGLLEDPIALRESDPIQRARVGDALARWGDPRFDPRQFYLPADAMLGFIRIPADPEFRIGTRTKNAMRFGKIVNDTIPVYEINDAFTPTSEFYVGRYPVTVAQLKAFVDAEKYELAEANALRDPDNRPARYVNWYEALAYCEWLNKILATAPIFKRYEVAQLVRGGLWRVTMPSELEWEKAARAEHRDSVFSWGNKPDPNRANYEYTKIGETSAVGCFPANGLGLYDMIGNVGEWTRSLWGTDYARPDCAYPFWREDRECESLDAADTLLRVVRGGSYVNQHDYARCACRSSSLPFGRADDRGFRVVLSSVPSSQCAQARRMR